MTKTKQVGFCVVWAIPEPDVIARNAAILQSQYPGAKLRFRFRSDAFATVVIRKGNSCRRWALTWDRSENGMSLEQRHKLPWGLIQLGENWRGE